MRATVFTAALAVAAFAPGALAQCSGGAACPPCRSCRVAPASGSNPSVPEMATLFDRVAAGPTAYGSLGWDFGGRNTIGAGAGWCGGSGRRDTVPVTFPCVLLKAIYLTESSWRQFCTTSETVISFDCGYGIAQVTSGMRRGETSAYDADRVASSAAYNVSVGAAILADKWRASACVGDNDPTVVEDWYFATWGYNGFVFRNNPNNPMFAADRREFRTPGVSSAQTRGNYPYQELVWGYSHYPLTAQHYTGIALGYPNRSEICSGCGRPTESISEPGPHRGGCPSAPVMDAGTPVVDAGPPDTGPRDTGPMDTGPTDTGTTDTGPTDVGAADATRDVGFADRTSPVDRPAAHDAGDADDPLAEPVPLEGGCGCRASGPSPARGGWLAALLAGLFLTRSASRRGRGRRPPSASRTRGG